MKYSILTVASKSYFPFLDIFLNSLMRNVDLEKVNKVYVVLIDFGDYVNDLVKSDKIVYIHENSKDEFTGVHRDGWYKNTKMKTHHLKDVLNLIPEDESLVLIDSDTLILKDFYDIIDRSYDLQVTQMSEGSHMSASLVEISHIACFMVFNDVPKSKRFLDKWMSNVEFLVNQNRLKPHETPAMNMTMFDMEFMMGYRVQSLDDRVVCSDLAIYPNSKVLHFKSRGGMQVTPYQNFVIRLQDVKCFTDEFRNLKFETYLTVEAFRRWANDDMNVNVNNFLNLAQKYK